MKTVSRILLVIIVIIVGLSLYLQPDDMSICLSSNSCSKADAVVALSGGDTLRRADHAINIYKLNLARIIIFSGAALDKSGPSNALEMKKYAINKGVDKQDILLDETSDNTKENAVNTLSIIKRHDIKSIILVTSGYHQKRANLEFSILTKAYPIKIINSPTNDKDWGWWWWITPKGWYLALSEFIKIIIIHIRMKI